MSSRLKKAKIPENSAHNKKSKHEDLERERERVTPRIGSSGARTIWEKTDCFPSFPEVGAPTMEWLLWPSTATDDGSRCLARTLNLRSAEGDGDCCVCILVVRNFCLLQYAFLFKVCLLWTMICKILYI